MSPIICVHSWVYRCPTVLPFVHELVAVEDILSKCHEHIVQLHANSGIQIAKKTQILPRKF